MTARIAGSTTDAPPQAGPYSQSVRIGDIVTCAGQAGFTPDGELVDGVAEQTAQTLRNIAATLAAVGATMDEVAHVRVYLTEVSQFAEMNAVYETFFTAPYPARTTVYVTLPPGLLVEIDAIAVSPAP
ncbi:MAG: RidA family protein [Actinomycetota bacterium]|nr:RidA family protein [Actinomycetota bacterium]